MRVNWWHKELRVKGVDKTPSRLLQCMENIFEGTGSNAYDARKILKAGDKGEYFDFMLMLNEADRQLHEIGWKVYLLDIEELIYNFDVKHHHSDIRAIENNVYGLKQKLCDTELNDDALIGQCNALEEAVERLRSLAVQRRRKNR